MPSIRRPLAAALAATLAASSASAGPIQLRATVRSVAPAAALAAAAASARPGLLGPSAIRPALAARPAPLAARPAIPSLSRLRGLVSGLRAEGSAALGRAFDVSASRRPLAADEPAAPGAVSPAQRVQLNDLMAVYRLYSEQYAPLEFKQRDRGVDIQANYREVETAVRRDKPGERAYQRLLSRFVAKLSDYHAGISFYGTESASLPFTVRGAEGRYFVAYVAAPKEGQAAPPVKKGDELLAFDGKPVSEAVSGLISAPNDPDTDQSWAEMALTRRSARGGLVVPKGDVTLTVRGADGAQRDVKVAWDYKPEQVKMDIPVRETPAPQPQDAGDDIVSGPIVVSPSLGAMRSDRSELRALVRKYFALKQQVAPGLETLGGGRDKKDKETLAAENPYMLGSKASYVPELGRVAWDLDKQLLSQGAPEEALEKVIFRARVYVDEQGRKIGYLRVPTYMADDSDIAIAKQIMKAFNANGVKDLVYDQVNNGGGSVDFMNKMISLLSSKTIKLGTHKIIIDGDLAQWAATIVDKVNEGKTDEIVEEALADAEGDPEHIDPQAMAKQIAQMVDFARFVKSQRDAGKRLSDPTHFFGVDEIEPDADHFQGRVYVVTNELDFSAADFLPSILQDNGVGESIGAKTAGAGGAVKSSALEMNQSDIEHVSYTWTIAQRINGQPIEGRGVTPGTIHKLTARDIQEDGADLKAVILGRIAANSPAPAQTDASDDDSGGSRPRPTPRRRPRR